jgi:hypothetical protein
MTQLNFDQALWGHRDGSTYQSEYDLDRLNAQSVRVARVMLQRSDWVTLRHLEEATGDPQASISARLRDFRKDRFGRKTVERRRASGGLFEYRLLLWEWAKMA